jgi:hypothetical protein
VCVCVCDVMCHSVLSDEPFFINCHYCYFHDKFCSKYEGHMMVINLFATAKLNLPCFCKNYHTKDHTQLPQHAVPIQICHNKLSFLLLAYPAAPKD